MVTARGVRIGCVGWALPADVQDRFPPGASHLQRYAEVLDAAEINSTFHRPHRHATFERWAASVPDTFGFSVKLPKAITHERRLSDVDEALRAFFDQCSPLGERLRCVLAQLPPSLAFDEPVAARFFAQLRACFAGAVAVEPRHASWFTPQVDAWLAQRRIARVLADPVRHDAGRWPGGWQDLIYLRLHGSPRTYYSPYPDDVLASLAARIRLALREGRELWCIFDNTAAGAATRNALTLRQLLAQT
jgi:uncharacterized protein YecE (DUF72 family)